LAYKRAFISGDIIPILCILNGHLHHHIAINLTSHQTNLILSSHLYQHPHTHTLCSSMASNSITGLFDNDGLQKKVLLPESDEYKERQESFWSLYSKVEPAVIVCPISAQEVSTILKTLTNARQAFAVRSGDHTQWTGASNIEGGVTIDLQHLNWVIFDKDTDMVDIGPGARWKEIYAELETHGRLVAGARNGKVGVGGLPLDGGLTFFIGQRGFACDDVVSYEVVLADGRIITADASNDHKDLFIALKGGSGNFGIVTNFKMQTFVCDKI
jgi:FAD/FMN-containing dehydrogenase